MVKKKNQLAKILDLITYKKTQRPKTFVLAEMENGQDQGEPSDGQNSNDSISAENNGQGDKGSNTEEQRSHKQDPKNDQNSKEEQSQSRNEDRDNKKSQNNKAGKNNKNAQDNKRNPGAEEHIYGSGRLRRRVNKKPLSSAQARSNRSDDEDEVKSDVDTNKKILMDLFGLPDNKDLVIREFVLDRNKRGFVAYLDGMANKDIINNFILRPLFEDINDSDEGNLGKNRSLENIVQTNDAKKLNGFKKVVTEILKGNTALYLNGLDYILTCESIGYDKRGVEAPKTEGIVKGPQEGFSENLRTNISLLRRIIRNSNIITEFFEVGEKSSSTIGIVYLKDVVNPAIVQEVRRRLTKIKTDFLVSDGMLEQLIEDNPYSIVPTILSTERPDRTASHLVEGRVAIIMDGSPFAMIVPVTMNAFMHSPEDAALKWLYTSFLRLIRYFAFLAASMLPALYIAFTTYHREMIPTDLLIAIAQAKENVPFPTVVEILLMEIGFELIREAGIRIPGIIGNTLGIIGALILGEAAVSANIVSPILIIVVAVTGLSNFSIPNYSLAFGVRLLRFYFIFAAAILGFYGIALAVAGFTLMLVNMKSFGVPFFSIIAPKSMKSRDKVFRYPLWMQETRPDFLNTLDRRRQPKISRQWTQEDPDKG